MAESATIAAIIESVENNFDRFIIKAPSLEAIAAQSIQSRLRAIGSKFSGNSLKYSLREGASL